MKITSSLKALAALSLVLGAMGSVAHANTVTLDVSPYGNLYGYGGGEFTALNTGLDTSSYSSSTLIGGGFETFCMAYNEEFTPANWGGPDYNFNLGNAILSNTGAAPDYLTAGSAWLYSQFATGNLAGYDYSTAWNSTRASSAKELQLAFWWLQQSPGAPAPDSTDPFVADVLSAFGGTTSAFTTADSTTSDGVSIMVLQNADGSYAQPQLYYSVPDNGTTVALLGIGLVTLVVLKRRFGAPKHA